MNFSERYGVCNPFEIKKAEAIANYFDIKLEIVEFDYWRRGPEITEKHKKTNEISNDDRNGILSMDRFSELCS